MRTQFPLKVNLRDKWWRMCDGFHYNIRRNFEGMGFVLGPLDHEIAKCIDVKVLYYETT